jgi:23S rRNA (cytosine1962-C5)-methyltransferase
MPVMPSRPASSRRTARGPTRGPAAGDVTPPANAVSPWVRLRSGTNSPMVYQRMVAAADPAAQPGDIVTVYDKAEQLFGRGLYNPQSQIALRMLTFADEAIDAAFWRGRLAQAVSLRRRLNVMAAGDAYRLVHAEGDGLSGLVVERFADVLALEVFSLGIWRRVGEIVAGLVTALPPPASLDRPDQPGAAWRVVVRADERSARLEGFDPATLPGPLPGGPPPANVVIREHGVRYRVDLAHGHKTGFFCDQRDNRRQFAALCADADVLDCCCYTGGFGLAAKLLGGAREVTAVDLDEAALVVARENVNLNNTRVKLVQADAFPYLRQMLANQKQYDAVVLDPPKLALTRRDLDDALKKYHDLNQLAIQTVRPGGVLLTCSCSGLVARDVFERTVHAAARRVGRQLQQFAASAAAPDHPVMQNCPESAYLKALWYRVL